MVVFLDESFAYSPKHDLDCVLAEVAAKRAILSEHKPSRDGRRESSVDTEELITEALIAGDIGQAEFPRVTIRSLATPGAEVLTLPRRDDED